MKLIVTLLCCLSGVSWAAQDQIEFLELKHRLATELMPQIEPVLPANAAISAQGNVLILRADANTHQQIRQLVEQLDQRLSSIRITVVRSQQRLEDRAGARDQLNLDFNNPEKSQLDIRRWSTQDSRERDQQFQVRGIEGRPVTLQLGQLIPQTDQRIYLLPQGAIVGESTYYLSAESGFQAIVNLLAEGHYQIELYPQFAQFNQRTGQLDSTQLMTTLNGALDQWLLIGQTGEHSQQLSGRQYRSHRDQQQFIYLKVETF